MDVLSLCNPFEVFGLGVGASALAGGLKICGEDEILEAVHLVVGAGPSARGLSNCLHPEALKLRLRTSRVELAAIP